MAPLFSTMYAILEGTNSPCFDYRQTGVPTIIIEDVLLSSSFVEHRKIPGKSQHDLSDADQPFLNRLYDPQDLQLSDRLTIVISRENPALFSG